jgi:peptidoglycan/LPS O-acetylase OafA/YrhL
MSVEAAAKPTSSHLAYLDGLRGLAALFVVVHHAYITVWQEKQHPAGLLQPLLAPLGFGHYAVVAFIVLSGYCLMLPVLRAGDGTPRGGWKSFFSRRAWRILPPYWLAMLVTLGLIAAVLGQKTGTHWDICLPITPKAVVGHLLLVQDLFNRAIGGKINHVYWSVAVEWHLYFLFPLLLWVYRKRGPTAMGAAALVLGFGAGFVLRKSALSGLTLHFLGLFGLGAFAAAVAALPKDAYKIARFSWGRLAFLAFFALAILSAWLGPDRAFGQWFALAAVDLLAGLASSLLILAVATSAADSKLAGFLSGKLPVFLGAMGYSLYLMHAPLLQLLWQYGLRPLGLAPQATFALLFLTLPLVIGGCWLFYLACERPFLNRKK